MNPAMHADRVGASGREMPPGVLAAPSVPGRPRPIGLESAAANHEGKEYF